MIVITKYVEEVGWGFAWKCKKWLDLFRTDDSIVIPFHNNNVLKIVTTKTKPNIGIDQLPKLMGAILQSQHHYITTRTQNPFGILSKIQLFGTMKECYLVQSLQRIIWVKFKSIWKSKGTFKREIPWMITVAAIHWKWVSWTTMWFTQKIQ